jgi:uncharacterized lipoprotein YbaY
MTKLWSMKLVVFVLLLLSAETFSGPRPVTVSRGRVQQSIRSGNSWLDSAPVNWNGKMFGLPRPDPGSAPPRPRCRDFVRQPETPGENALVRAGWSLYGAVQSWGTARLVTAMSSVDGMCRPLGYQAFVYWDGRYAGTLSPAVMNSRTDGALTNIRLLTATRIAAEFSRYGDRDPLCCPTRITHVTYELSRDDLPLVTPTRINTVPIGGRPDASDPEPAPDDARPFGKLWRLVEVNGVAIRTTKPYIEFDRETRRFSGDGGCNRISGGFEIDGSNLTFSGVVSTRRACLDREVQQVENDFLRALEQTTRFQIRDDTLRFFSRGTPILTFRADAAGTGQEASVTGSVTYMQRIALTPDAIVEVKLLDVSRADAPGVTIAEQVIRPAGRQVPIEFELRYDPGRIQMGRRYVIQARILEGGNLRFINSEAYPVITGGNPNTVRVIVQPVRRQ